MSTPFNRLPFSHAALELPFQAASFYAHNVGKHIFSGSLLGTIHSTEGCSMSKDDSVSQHTPNNETQHNHKTCQA